MKNIFFVLAGTFLLLHSTHSYAQQRAYTAATDVLTVNGITINVANVFTLDSMKTPHYTSFDIDVSADGDTKRVLELFFNSLQNKSSLKLTIQKLNFQLQVQETRNYNGAIIADIIVPDLNATSKDALKFRVKVLSSDLSSTEGGSSSMKPVAKTKMALASNFKLVLGNLPAARTIAINNLRMTNYLINGYINFNIDIARVDSRQWKDWFTNGAGGGKREQGTITLLEANLQTELATIQLTDVEIVSVSEMDSSSDTIAKTTIGLRARRVVFTLNAK